MNSIENPDSVSGQDRRNAFLLPSPPVLTSHGAGWNDLHLEFHRQLAFHIPEYSPSRHVICINTGNPIPLDRRVDGRSQTLDAIPRGDIGIYPASVRQCFQWYREAEFIYLYLEPALLIRAAEALDFHHAIALEPQLNIGQDALIYQIALALKSSLENEGANGKLYVDAMANALAVHLLSRYVVRSPVLAGGSQRLSKGQVDSVVAYIHARLNQEIRLAELANIAHLSEFHFARLFKQTLGCAPHQYHIRCRVERAKQLLRTGHQSIAEIAYQVGFSSQSHLHYHFKRHLGVTPKAFLRRP